MYSEICDFLYVGSANAITSANKFDLIINCTSDMRQPKQYKQFIRLPINDDTNDIDNTLSIIDKTGVLAIIHTAISNRQHVLVHCYAGEQRSCAIVACYLIMYQGMKSDEAIVYIQDHHEYAFNGGVNLIKLLEKIEVQTREQQQLQH
ncbi:MAG: dual specificity protein phosphatase family protein [Flavobacterium sp.]